MARAWLIDSRGFAVKVKNANLGAAYQVNDCGANLECPNCKYLIDNSDVSCEWPGLPVGVKFDPSDAELLEHLAAKCGAGDSKPHMFIDEFIPTLEGDEGICYTHPENLPGAKKDGSSVHFFYQTMNAYASGQRKRRRIHDQQGVINSRVRWHKTGKTKPVIVDGVQKGCKKIMVLYSTAKKGTKPDKCNWVMHQYHLGTNEDEKEGEYVVSKISYQLPKDTDKSRTSIAMDESDDLGTVRTSPKTPRTTIPDPPRAGATPSSDYGTDELAMKTPIQDVKTFNEASYPSSNPPLKDEMEYPITSLAGESQPDDLSILDDSLLCNETVGSYMLKDFGRSNAPPTQLTHNTNEAGHKDANSACGIGDLENLELDTPPDFQLGDLQFPSQDSIFDWLDGF